MYIKCLGQLAYESFGQWYTLHLVDFKLLGWNLIQIYIINSLKRQKWQWKLCSGKLKLGSAFLLLITEGSWGFVGQHNKLKCSLNHLVFFLFFIKARFFSSL